MVAPNAVNAPLRCSKNAAGEKNGETCAWRRASLPSCAERSTRLICCAKLQPIRVRCAVLHAIRAGTRLVFGLSVEKDAFVRHLLYKCLASVDYQRKTLLPTYRIVDFSAQHVRIVSISAQSLSIVLLFAPHTRIARESAQEPTCKQGRRGSSPRDGRQNEKGPAAGALTAMVGAEGLEPSILAAEDFKSPAYANSATPPWGELCVEQFSMTAPCGRRRAGT